MARHRDQKESPLTRMESSVRSIDAKMKLLAQRLKVIEMNEQVIGRTLVSHNKKLKEIESRGSSKMDDAALRDQLYESLKSDLMVELKDKMPSAPMPPASLRIEEAGTRDNTNEEEIKNLKKAMLNLKQEVDEMKYVLDSVNPMEYVTIPELGNVIEKKVEKILEEKKD